MVEWHWARPGGMVGGTEGDKVQLKCKNLVTGHLMSTVMWVSVRVCMDGWMSDGWMGRLDHAGTEDGVVWRGGKGGRGGGKAAYRCCAPSIPSHFCRSHSKAQMMLGVAAERGAADAHTQLTQLVVRWLGRQAGGGWHSGCQAIGAQGNKQHTRYHSKVDEGSIWPGCQAAGAEQALAPAPADCVDLGTVPCNCRVYVLHVQTACTVQ